jgi:hypothetical protein
VTVGHCGKLAEYKPYFQRPPLKITLYVVAFLAAKINIIFNGFLTVKNKIIFSNISFG